MLACQSEPSNAMPNENEGSGRTLIVYYSYTGNTELIVSELSSLITADVVEVEPADKTLNYEANNYRIGTEQLTAIQRNPNDRSSYPALDPVSIDLTQYQTVIIATPLWWSQMASNMQSFLFQYGPELSGKKIGLIVSSHSSGISGVEADAHRLVPGGDFCSPSLWINAANLTNRRNLLEQWLKDIHFDTMTDLQAPEAERTAAPAIYDISGRQLSEVPAQGVYIENCKKVMR